MCAVIGPFSLLLSPVSFLSPRWTLFQRPSRRSVVSSSIKAGQPGRQ
jgi:hypothetical protein